MKVDGSLNSLLRNIADNEIHRCLLNVYVDQTVSVDIGGGWCVSTLATAR